MSAVMPVMSDASSEIGAAGSRNASKAWSLYGIEFDPRYCDVIVRRLAATAKVAAIHAATGKSFAEIERERAAEFAVDA